MSKKPDAVFDPRSHFSVEVDWTLGGSIETPPATSIDKIVVRAVPYSELEIFFTFTEEGVRVTTYDNDSDEKMRDVTLPYITVLDMLQIPVPPDKLYRVPPDKT